MSNMRAWAFGSIIFNLGLLWLLCVQIRNNRDAKYDQVQLRCENTKLYYENMYYSNEIKRLNELIEFHKQLNGVQ